MFLKSADPPRVSDMSASILKADEANWYMHGLAVMLLLITPTGLLARQTGFSSPADPPLDMFTSTEWLLIGALALVLLTLPLALIWTLRRTVHARTMALSDAFVEQKRLADILQSNEGRLAFAMDVIGEG